MKSRKEVEREFTAELCELLKKWDAEIQTEDFGRGYNQDIRMTVSIPGKWDGDGETIREYADIELGTCFDGVKR